MSPVVEGRSSSLPVDARFLSLGRGDCRPVEIQHAHHFHRLDEVMASLGELLDGLRVACPQDVATWRYDENIVGLQISERLISLVPYLSETRKPVHRRQM